MVVILQSVVSGLVGTLAPLVKDEIIFLMGVPDEIEKLRTRLQRILPVLAEADKRRLQEKAIDTWVQQLRDVVYDVEDVIDECKLEAKKWSSGRNQIPSSVSCCFSPFSCFSHYGAHRHQMGNKIKCLNQKLDDIIKDIPILNLGSTPLGHDIGRTISRETSPLVEPNLVGERIEKDARMLVDLLLSEEHHTQQKISVFAIVGMGGIGKTTLAQKICDDDKLQSEFHHIPPIWVCVSQVFSEIDLLKMLIHRAGGNPGEFKYKADLEPMLNRTIKDKKLFLVLDDVWNSEVWEELLYKPLQSCSAGSRVLVTTRHEDVARSMGARHCHRVERLPDKDGWSLLSKMVFLEEDENDIVCLQNNLRKIGMEIVRKCDGLPLAIKTIAGVLRNKDKRQREWEKVLENPAWTLTELPQGVMGALYLSYTELPTNLKQCFLYCSLFPEDHEFLLSDFVPLWISEGFVEAKENTLLEELANGYWNELVCRNLLERQRNYYRCKMHDLLHSLARHLASNECSYQDMKQLSGRSTSYSSWSMKVRRVHIRNSTEEAVVGAYLGHGSLRTLILPCLRNFTKDVTTKLKFLRILDIRGAFIDSLPNSIGELIHLKYLNVSRTAIREIPESIGNLENLQFLLMRGCKNLQSLPKSITNLCNLRRLTVGNSGVRNMPIGIGKLKSLTHLSGFLVFSSNNINREVEEVDQGQSCRRYCSLQELGSLPLLMTLRVDKLERASSREEATAAAIKAKSHLIHLGLTSSDVEPHAYYRKEEIEKISEVFEELCPPLCIEQLTIGGYFGLKYPSWMMEPPTFLPNLRVLVLINCVFCEQLLPLGLLPHLDSLRIVGASAVKSIGPEFFGFGDSKVNAGGGEAAHPRSSFPKLKLLIFRNMPNWVEWSWCGKGEEEEQLLPRLCELVLEGCPKLRLLPEGLICHSTALTRLWIKGAHSLTQVQTLLHLQYLELTDCPHLERVSHLPVLKTLVVESCGGLKYVESLNALEFLDLKDSETDSLPEWLLGERQEEMQFQGLRRLRIEGTTQLLSRCTVGGSHWVKIQHIPRVYAYRISSKPAYYIRYTKSPFSFNTNLPNNGESTASQCATFNICLLDIKMDQHASFSMSFQTPLTPTCSSVQLTTAEAESGDNIHN